MRGVLGYVLWTSAEGGIGLWCLEVDGVSAKALVLFARVDDDLLSLESCFI